MSSSTRKRGFFDLDDDDDDESPDTRLARRLQAEEYDKVDPKRLKTSYPDTDDETDASIIIDYDSDELRFIKSRVKISNQSRQSSSNTKNTVANPHVIPDTDDESDLPEFDMAPFPGSDSEDWFDSFLNFSEASEASGDESGGDIGLSRQLPSSRQRYRDYAPMPYENPQQRRVS